MGEILVCGVLFAIGFYIGRARERASTNAQMIKDDLILQPDQL